MYKSSMLILFLLNKDSIPSVLAKKGEDNNLPRLFEIAAVTFAVIKKGCITAPLFALLNPIIKSNSTTVRDTYDSFRIETRYQE